MNKFQIGNVVRHVDTGNIYIVFNIPGHKRLVSTGGSFYEYHQPLTKLTWLMAKADFENGQFELIAESMKEMT